MATRILPPQAFLRECFDYNPHTGLLTWKARPQEHFQTARAWKIFNSQFAGKTVTTTGKLGYVIVNISPHGRCNVHRVIWKWMTGNDALQELDHINHNPSDNRWANLRSADHPQNLANQTQHADNETGFKGVFRKRQKFTAQIMFHGKRYSLGVFSTAEEAHAAYCEAARRLFGEFWHP